MMSEVTDENIRDGSDGSLSDVFVPCSRKAPYSDEIRNHLLENPNLELLKEDVCMVNLDWA